MSSTKPNNNTTREQRAFWVEQVNANMSIEGVELDEFSRDLQRRYIDGTMPIEGFIEETRAAFLAEEAALLDEAANEKNEQPPN